MGRNRIFPVYKLNLSIRIAAIYIFTGLMWILFSDFILEIFVNNKIQLTTFQTIKGVLFILITGTILFFLLNRYTKKIHEIEERFRNTVEEVKDYAIFLLDKDGKIASWNKGAEKLNGYTSEEITGRHFSIFYTEEEFKNNIPNEILRIPELKGKYITEGKILRKNGSSFFAHVTITPLKNHNKELIGFLNITHDMSERKKIEETLSENHEEIRSLMENLVLIREEERTNISREIHDELGQILTSIKIDLSWLSNNLKPYNLILDKRISTISDKIDISINIIKKIASDLRPGEIDIMGIEAAIESELSSLQERTGIKTELINDGLDLKINNQKASIYIYRIFQEAITNILRHSQASSIEVNLASVNNNFRLIVKDNGKGFDTKKILRNSFGLIGMNERAAMIGGNLTIESSPGDGTKILLEIPGEKLN